MSTNIREAVENTFFKDDDGQITLGWLLRKLNHFAASSNDPEIAIRQNIAKEILTECNRWEGVDVQEYIKNLPRVIKEQENE